MDYTGAQSIKLQAIDSICSLSPERQDHAGQKYQHLKSVTFHVDMFIWP